MIIGRQSGLGRGLGALIPPKRENESVAPPSVEESRPVANFSVPGESNLDVREIPVEEIERNPHQPRHHFDHGQLEDLIASIQAHGILQPLVVTLRPSGGYELIAGERRWRAATIAGLKTVPAIVRDATEQQKLELAIIENVQRQDLNPLEEAYAYTRLMEEFNLTQDEVGQKVGKSRPQVANTIRLLQLPEDIQAALVAGKISASNARTLLSVPTAEERTELFQAMLAGHFTVRQTEARVSGPRRRSLQDPNLIATEERLRAQLNCRVHIKRDPKGEGEIRLKFFSDEELQALLDTLGRLASG